MDKMDKNLTGKWIPNSRKATKMLIDARFSHRKIMTYCKILIFKITRDNHSGPLAIESLGAAILYPPIVNNGCQIYHGDCCLLRQVSMTLMKIAKSHKPSSVRVP